MIVIEPFEEFEVSHRETALLGADPGAFLPGVNLVRIRMISKRTMMTLLKLMRMPSSYPLPVSASLGLFPPALRKLLLDCFRDTFVSSSSSSSSLSSHSKNQSSPLSSSQLQPSDHSSSSSSTPAMASKQSSEDIFTEDSPP